MSIQPVARSNCELKQPTRLTRLAVPVLLMIHTGLLAWVAYRYSPVVDEVAHLPAGISHWEFGRFELYRVNPPLVRSIAAIPVMLAGAETDWSAFHDDPYARSEFAIGRRFCEINGFRVFWLFTLSRFICIPFSLIGAWFCYRWACDLFGACSGLVALTLWCFSPNVITWGATICPDAAASSFGVMACYAFWRWLRQPRWSRALIAGLTLGLAELTKTTWITLFFLWPPLWLFDRWWSHKSAMRVQWKCEFGQILTLMLLGLYLINLAYGFEGSFKLLRNYVFISHTLGGTEAHLRPGNRFSHSSLGAIPIPVPENYLRGIDVQKSDFERGKWSFLRGEYKIGGWWHYYLYGLLVKEPIGTWAMLVVLMLTSPIWRYNFGAQWRDQVVLLAPGLAVFLLVSSQTGFNRYVRYVLPVFPFAFIWLSQAAQVFHLRTTTSVWKLWTLRTGIFLSLIGSLSESLYVYPHSLSFFNIAAGGPLGGPRHLLDANIEWEQDLLYLRDWAIAHPQARPLRLICEYGFVNPKLMDINVEAYQPQLGAADNPYPQPLKPGWYAISANIVFDYPPDISSPLQQLIRDRPFGHIGYSLYLYHLQ